MALHDLIMKCKILNIFYDHEISCTLTMSLYNQQTPKDQETAMKILLLALEG